MVYQALPSKDASDTLTLSNYNAIKANFEASGIDIVTTKGDIVGATGANALARLAVGSNASYLIAASAAATGLAWQKKPLVRVYNSANLDLAPDGWRTVTFDTDRYDTDGMHDTAENTERLTIPSGCDGYYCIGGNVEFDSSGSAAGEARIGIRVLYDGTAVLAQKLLGLSNEGEDFSIPIATVYAGTATHYYSLQIYTSGDWDVQATDYYSPAFYAYLVRGL